MSYIADFEKAVEIGRPPNIRTLFPNSRALNTVKFDVPVLARYARFTALTEHSGRDTASAAGIAFLTD